MRKIRKLGWFIQISKVGNKTKCSKKRMCVSKEGKVRYVKQVLLVNEGK